MSTYTGEIAVFSFSSVPSGWMICDGRLLPISQYQALFTVLGIRFGGDGATTFGLPDLRGRVPFAAGGSYQLGQNGGEEKHILSIVETPSHSHSVLCSDMPAPPTDNDPGLDFWGIQSSNLYANFETGFMSDQAISNTGNNQGHENRGPYLVLNFCIATNDTN